MERLKAKWGITSNLQLAVILIVFAISGSLSMFLSKPLLSVLGVEKEKLSLWVFWPVRIVVMFLSYYIVLVSVGTIFGQHRFFAAFAKKTFGRFMPKGNS